MARYRPFITAVLSGFDRLVFRGTLLGLVMQGGMYTFLTRAQVGLLDFKPYVLATSERVRAAALREAVEQNRPIRYPESSATDKEALARRLLTEHPVDDGLICVPKTVEPFMSFEYQLGRPLHPYFSGELVSRLTARSEGVRVKHWVNGNSIKMYDKAGSILIRGGASRPRAG